METSSVTSSAFTSTASGTSAQQLENQFMELLVAQLKNQDPLNPMENEQFVSELAQLQSLEAQQELAQMNESLLLQTSLSAGASMIGKEVTGNITQSGQLTEVTGEVRSLRVENGSVVFQVQTEFGLVSMSPDNLKAVGGVSTETSAS
jgi:flagellar basal-body rod modification protein FlgD